jgi:hypothetical protein
LTSSTLYGTIQPSGIDMTKKEKLEAKIRNNPKNVSLDEFESLINKYGHINMGGKHAKARIGNFTLTYKRANPVPFEYVIDLLDIIDTL